MLKRKLMVWLTALFMALSLMAGVAQADHGPRVVKNGDTAGAITYDPAFTVYCPSGETWHIKSYTRGFAPRSDRSGTLTWVLDSAGFRFTASHYNANWEGLTKTWDSNRSSTTFASASYSGMNSSGEATVTFYCT